MHQEETAADLEPGREGRKDGHQNTDVLQSPQECVQPKRSGSWGEPYLGDGQRSGLQRRLKEQPEIGGQGNVEVIARRQKQPTVLNAA